MTTHWPRLDAARPLGAARSGRLELAFFRHGERTRLGRQFVSYPFHVTRPFLLDAAIPSLSTVYLQSSSGGLYRAEDLACRLAVGAKAAAHVTTQAATVVHDCHGKPSRQHVSIAVDQGAFLAYTPDPLVLFPGASCHAGLEATLAADAVMFLADAFASHDPTAVGRPFDRLRSDVAVRDPHGTLLIRDSFDIAGATLRKSRAGIAGWAVISNFFVLGDSGRLPGRDVLADAATADAIVGVTALPGKAGWGVRCLARDAVAARRVADSLFALCVEAAFGVRPAKRRK
ncbi:MAG: urease accessory protein UreD [Rhizobiaceae bacterium]|nr:urease accessory protein UreD [Rhizobiaceae bacterium]